MVRYALLAGCTVSFALKDRAPVINCQTQDDCPADLRCHDVKHQCLPANYQEPGIRVTAASALTSETGAVAAISVQLLSRPSAPVTLGLSSNDESEGRLSALTLTIQPDEWEQPKQISVAGQPDYSGVSGDANFTDNRALTGGNYQCANTARLLCVQQ